ncbi:MAG TPA: alpha-amylase family glycosyl hydrolase, partial [Acidimicrobiia bacterium]
QAVIYQIYIRSFADANADGTGDIAGIISRLPYLASLGVDGIWINPWYVSPLRDGGYDVADYRHVNPMFGDLDQAKRLFEEAGRLGIKVLVDLVPNHTSDEHVWFRAALAAKPGSSERDRYHFLPGRGEHGQLPPNNWKSVFGGSAWTRVPDGEWYLHMFDVSQPDLNWENREVREEFLDIIRYWLDLGADGFRVDVAHALVKEADYPDAVDDRESVLSTPDGEGHPLWDRPELHDVVREWRVVLDEYEDKVMVAEAWIPSWSRLALYVRDDEYHQTFAFQFLRSPWDAGKMETIISEALAATGSVGSVPTWVLSNHDVVRQVTRYGLAPDVDERAWLLNGDPLDFDQELGLRRARAAGLMMLALPGSVYLYQGEELGLPEVHDLPEGVIDDPVWERSGKTAKGRDGCRVPIPWTRDGDSFGFGDDGSWLPQPDQWAALSVESQENVDGSTLELYRKAIDIRNRVLRDSEEMQWVDTGSDALVFSRGGRLACVVNFGSDPIPVPQGEVVLASESVDGGLLPGNSAVWVESG